MRKPNINSIKIGIIVSIIHPNLEPKRQYSGNAVRLLRLTWSNQIWKPAKHQGTMFYQRPTTTSYSLLKLF